MTTHVTEQVDGHVRIAPALIDQSRGIWTRLNSDTMQQWQRDTAKGPYFVYALAPMEDDPLTAHALNGTLQDEWMPGYRLYRWHFATEGLATSLQNFLAEFPGVSSTVFHQYTQ